MPQFSLKRMLASVTAVATGFACLVCFSRAGSMLSDWDEAVILLASGTLIGAGIFAPFKLATLGGFLGFFAVVLVSVVMVRLLD